MDFIHGLWLGSAPLPELSRRCIESWRRLHGPDRVRIWTDADLAGRAWFEDLRRRASPAFVSDVARFEILVEHGGIYLDTDMELIRPVRPSPVELEICEESPGRIGFGYVSARAGSSAVRELFEIVHRFRCSGRNVPINDVLGEVVKRYHAAGTAVILPPRCFYPYNPYDRACPRPQLMYADIDPDTLGIHHWSHSWFDDSDLRAVGKKFLYLLGRRVLGR